MHGQSEIISSHVIATFFLTRFHVSQCLFLTLSDCPLPPFLFFSFFFSIRKLFHLHMSLLFFNTSKYSFLLLLSVYIARICHFVCKILHVYIYIYVGSLLTKIDRLYFINQPLLSIKLTNRNLTDEHEV